MNLSKHWAATLDDYVIDLAWSPDGTLLAAASAAGGVTLYDAATGAVKHLLAGHENGTNCLVWMPVSEPHLLSTNSQLLFATGGQDGCVRIWDAATGRQTAEAKLGAAWVEHLAWQSLPQIKTGHDNLTSDLRPLASGLLFASAGKKLVALNPDGSVAHTFPDAPKTISALALSPSSVLRPPSSVLAAACFGEVVIWDTANFTARKTLPYGNAILALTWSPDSRWLVAGCHDNAVHLWIPGEDLELHMSGYENRLKELSFSRDSKWLATGGGRDACVWDCTGAGPEGREPLLLPHQARVCAVAFQHQHGLLASGAADGEFCLWAPTRKNPLVAEVKMPAAATKFVWRADDSLLAVGTENGAVFVFRTGE
jgi:WD40 repeat protein